MRNQKKLPTENNFFKKISKVMFNNQKIPANWFDSPMDPNTVIMIKKMIRRLVIDIAKGTTYWGDTYLFAKMTNKYNNNLSKGVASDTTTLNGLYNNGYLIYFASNRLRHMLFEEACTMRNVRKIEYEDSKYCLDNLYPNDKVRRIICSNKKMAYDVSEIIVNSMQNLCNGDIQQLSYLPATLLKVYPIKAILNEPDDIW